MIRVHVRVHVLVQYYSRTEIRVCTYSISSNVAQYVYVYILYNVHLILVNIILYSCTSGILPEIDNKLSALSYSTIYNTNIDI